MPVQNLRVFGKSKQITTIGKNLWSLGDVSFNTYKELLINYPAGDYVLSYSVETEATSTTTQVGINTDGNWKYSQIKKGNRAIIKISSTTGVTAVRFYAGDSPAYNVNAKYYDIQVEEGTEATGYEPYTGGKPSPSPEYPQEIVTAGESGTIDLEITGENVEPQSITLQTPNGLPGIKVDKDGNYTDKNGQQWITDEIDLARGKYVQRVDKIEANGATIKFTAYGGYWNLPQRSTKGIVSTKILSNISTRFSANLTYEFIFCGENTLAEYFTTVDELNNYCLRKYNEGNPVVFYYATSSIERDLTPEEIQAYKALHTNYQSTVITNDENAGMEVSYIADTKNYIDKKFKELNQAIVNTQIALL